MAELAEYDEVEPDMEHDPTLASCCRREIKDRRIKQSKLDHIRSGMPATLVDKSLITSICAKGENSTADKRAEHGAMTEEEIDAALNDELDLEFQQLRLTRLQQLREGAPSNTKNVNEKKSGVPAKRGALSGIAAEAVLGLVDTGLPIVALLIRGDQVLEAPKRSAPQDDVAAGIAGHMTALATEFVGSYFVTVAIDGKEGDSLRHMLSVSDLPAFICLRRGVIVSIVMGSRLRQFVQMGPVGGAIFRAWLHEARMLYSTPEDAQAAAGAQEELMREAARRQQSDRRTRRRRNHDGDDPYEESGDSDGSDISGESQEEDGESRSDEDEDAGWTSFVGRRDNRSQGGKRVAAAVEGMSEMGGFGIDGAGPSARLMSRAQTSDQKTSSASVRGCTDPKCRNRCREGELE